MGGKNVTVVTTWLTLNGHRVSFKRFSVDKFDFNLCFFRCAFVNAICVFTKQMNKYD